MNFCENSEELMAVLGHELGHAEERHIMNRLAKEIGLSIILNGDDFVIAEVSKMIGSSKFNRVQEKEADTYAFELLTKIGIDPRVMASFFRRIQNQRSTNLDMLELFNSHPNPEKRIKHALSYELPKDFTPKKSGFEIETLKNRLQEILQ